MPPDAAGRDAESVDRPSVTYAQAHLQDEVTSLLNRGVNPCEVVLALHGVLHKLTRDAEEGGR
jgi:hypothetical protein